MMRRDSEVDHLSTGSLVVTSVCSQQVSMTTGPRVYCMAVDWWHISDKLAPISRLIIVDTRSLGWRHHIKPLIRARSRPLSRASRSSSHADNIIMCRQVVNVSGSLPSSIVVCFHVRRCRVEIVTWQLCRNHRTRWHVRRTGAKNTG